MLLIISTAHYECKLSLDAAVPASNAKVNLLERARDRAGEKMFVTRSVIQLTNVIRPAQRD